MAKGQLSSMDLAISVMVFVFLLVSIISFWNIYVLRFDANLNHKELALKAVTITDLMVENTGIPTAWNKTTAQVIGLTEKDRRLDSNKLSALLNMSYSQIKGYLNIDANEFYFRVVDMNGALVKAQGQVVEIGNQTANTDFIVKIRRFTLYGSQKTVLEFLLWQ